MVVRLVLMIFLALPSLAIAAEKSKALSLANEYYSKNRFIKSLSVLVKNFDIKKLSKNTPAKAYVLASKNFIKLKKYKIGIRFIRRAIARDFARQDKEAMNTYFKQGNADGLDKLPSKLYYYYYLILLSSVEYGNELIKNGIGPDETLNQYVEVFGNILLEAEYNEDAVTKITTRFETLIQEIERREFQSNWYVNFGYVSWQDKVEFIDTDGNSYDLIAPAEGLSIGLGWQKANFFWGYKFESNMSLLKANAGFNSTSVSYFQQSVNVSMIDIKGGVFTKPFTGDVAIGLNIPIIMTAGDYATVENTKIIGATKITSGLLLEGVWITGNWSLSSQFGKVVGLHSAYWDVHLSYHF